MLGKLCNWFDHRTGYRRFVEVMLLEHIPGGARWRYVWGSCLAFVFLIQVVTGILLMTAYSPGDTTAWGSVYYIQYEMDFGWLIRGLHHFGSQTMVVLLALHMLQVVIAGAHLPPREINWWLGLLLMGIVLGLSLTGYLLPWDQKGYYATQVATNLIAKIPGIGDFIQKVLVGGPEYGNGTLTRFFALHVGILPAILVILLIAHIAVFRRHGITAPRNAEGEGWFWPDQAFRDLLACLLVFGIMIGLVVFGEQGNKIANHPQAEPESSFYESWAKAGRDGLGANLDAPADRETSEYPARPEWYFLFLFQFLKYFKGEDVAIGAIYIPNAVMLGLFLLPLFGIGRMRKFGHFIGIVYVVALLACVGLLTLASVAADSPAKWLDFARPKESEEYKEALDAAVIHQKHLKEADKAAKRAVELAADGIPAEGAVHLLRNDPKMKGPRLFAEKCAGCHRYSGHDDAELNKILNNPKGNYKAADLAGYGTAAWIRGLLNNPGSDSYFGKTELGGMKRWRSRNVERLRDIWRKKDPEDAKTKIADQEEAFDTISDWLAQQALPEVKRNKALEEKGEKLFAGMCNSCHSIGGQDFKEGPDFTSYGSQEWIRLMLMHPAHPSRYPSTNTMPAFRPTDGPGAEIQLLEFTELEKARRKLAEVDNPELAKEPERPTSVSPLSDIDRELIVRWLTRDNRVVFGGQAISGAKKRP